MGVIVFGEIAVSSPWPMGYGVIVFGEIGLSSLWSVGGRSWFQAIAGNTHANADANANANVEANTHAGKCTHKRGQNPKTAHSIPKVA